MYQLDEQAAAPFSPSAVAIEDLLPRICLAGKRGRKERVRIQLQPPVKHVTTSSTLVEVIANHYKSWSLLGGRRGGAVTLAARRGSRAVQRRFTLG